jgi:tripartite ATP-independent transporter DctM subunit
MRASAGRKPTISCTSFRSTEGRPMPVLVLVFLMALLVGVPVFVALAGSSLIYTHFIAGIPDFIILHRMAGGLDSFPLLAVPFFILAGNLMNSAGITNRIYDFAVATCGWMRGGLAHVNIFGSVIFAGMSGTAIADAAGLGTIEIKAMQDHGYDLEFSVGVTAASATLGPIIPPSLPFVIYGMMGNVSIGALFLAGFIPGAVMTIFMMLYASYCARRYGMGPDQKFRWIVLGRTFIAALPALLTPALIVGGMTFGWFTPTEAAIAACTWALILGVFLYRSLSLKQFYKVTMDTIETTAGVLLVVAAASLFGWVLTTTRLTEAGAAALLNLTDNKYIILLLINVLLLVVGCFLETIASISILVPVLMPIILKVGIDPVHFGVVMTLNLMIGLLHPPLGMVLFVLSRISKLSIERTTMAILPWLIPLLMSLLAITLIPELTLWLPRQMGMLK